MPDKIHHMGSNERGEVYSFHCPGCGYGHAFEVPRWNWNGSLDKPTFTPSLLVNKDMPDSRCHLIMTDGKIQFCMDSHHSLKGQLVEIPDWDS
jgi:Family of unknown function (DUF6527)